MRTRDAAALPEGFVLDEVPQGGGLDNNSQSMDWSLPPGFVLDAPPAGYALDAPPAGYALDEPTQRREPTQAELRKSYRTGDAETRADPPAGYAADEPTQRREQVGYDDEVGRLGTAGSSLVRGAADVPAGMAKGIAIIKEQENRKILKIFDEIDATGSPPDLLGKPLLLIGVIKNYFTGDAETRAALRAEYAPQDPRDRTAYKAGEWISDEVKKALPVNPEYAEEFLAGKVPQGIGSTMGFVATAILGGMAGGPAASMLMTMGAGAAVNASEQYEDAIKHGASIEDAFLAADLAAIVGTSEAIPIARLLDRYDKITGGSIKRLIIEAIKQGGAEAAQETFQSIAANLIASDVVEYDPKRGMFKGTGEAFGVGFTVGALMEVIFSLILPGGRRGGTVQGSAEQAQPQSDGIDIPEGAIPAGDVIGDVEASAATPGPRMAPVTAEDEASPIPTDAISRGKAVLEDAVDNRPLDLARSQSETTDISDAMPRPESRPSAPKTAADMELVDPDTVQTDAQRFQFKSGGDAQGVTDTLRGVREFNPDFSGVAIVWEDIDGNRFIVDGHQRLSLAKRAKASGQDGVSLRARVLREADGVTAKDARFQGALKNLAEGGESTTSVDVARLFRNGGSREMAARYIPPSRRAYRDGEALANLGDQAWGMVVNEIVPANFAAEVGRQIQEPTQQIAALDYMAKNPPANIDQARIMVGQINAAGYSEGTQDSLFGTEALSETLIAERARVLDSAARQLRSVKKVFSTAINSADVLSDAGNVLDAEANQRQLTENEQLALALEKLATRKGAISNALSEAARSLKRGQPLGQARDQFLQAVRDIDAGTVGGSEAERGLDAAPAADAVPDREGSEGVEAQSSAGEQGGNTPVLGALADSAPDFSAASTPVETATEQTDQGEQSLFPGVAPVTDRDRLDVERDRPMRGGNAPMDGGLFDTAARGQGDLLDAAPAAQTAEATPELTVRDFSDKSIIVEGKTKENLDRIKSAIGRRPLWNKRAKGWIFPKKDEAKVREALADLLGAAPAAQTAEAIDREALHNPRADEITVDTLSGLSVGDTVDVPTRTIGRSTIEALWVRQTSAGRLHMAKVRSEDGKPLSVAVSETRRVTPSETDANSEQQAVREGRLPVEDDRDRQRRENIAKMEAQAEPEAPARPSTYGANNKLISADRAEEARRKLRAKLRGKLPAGIDPEIIAEGTVPAVFHVEAGARKFSDFAKAIVEDLGDAAKPFVKMWYNAARDYPGMVSGDMTPYEEVTAADLDAVLGEADGVQSDVPAGDAGASAQDAQIPPEDGSDGQASGQDGETGVSDVRGTDARPDGGERQSATVGTSAGRGNRSGNTDKLSSGRSGRDRSPRADDGVKGENFAIEPGALAEDRGWKTKARDNITAIETLRAIEAEGRPATRTEQETLARYVGWGALSGVFPDPQTGAFAKGYEDIGQQLRELLNDTEYNTARRSTQYAHYTSEAIVRGMWGAAGRMGFKGGKVFEPGMGVGNFAGMMPRNIADATAYNGLELDHTTARIARLLYPKWGVRQDDFTKAPLPENTYDLVIGNPPFADIPITSDPKYASNRFLLHDYFFAKSLDAVRPGGLLMFISSAGTMNKKDTKAREYMADRANLVGAVRLPGDAFARNAGTQVTTDIVVLRKRLPGEQPGDRSWTETVQSTLPAADGSLKTGLVNRYFAENRDMVLGEEGFFDKLYQNRYAVRAIPGENIETRLAEAFARLPVDAMSPWQDTTERAEVDFGTSERKESSYYVGQDGELYQMSAGVGTKVDRRGKGVKGGKTAGEIARIKKLIPVRDALRAVYAADLAEDTANADKARKRLNETYNAFVEKFGPINQAKLSSRRPTVIQAENARSTAREEARYAGEAFDEGTFDPRQMIAGGAKISEIAKARKEAREAWEAQGRVWSEGTFDPAEMPDIAIDKRPNVDPFMGDPESYRLRSIEHYDDATGETAKGNVFRENVITKDRQPTINGVGDALLYVLRQTGGVDLNEIARYAGVSREQALSELGDNVFLSPGSTDSYEIKEAYLSGNVRRKLRIAKAAAAKDDRFQRNVKALEAVQPAPLPPSEINAHLGMPWLPTETIEQFGRDALGLKNLNVTFIEKLAMWKASGDVDSLAAQSTFGTQERSAPELIDDALNRRTPRITRKERDADGNTISVLDPVATQAAQEKMSEIKARFRDWIWSDPERADRLANYYNEEYNNLVVREHDGSYLTTPGIDSSWRWRPHQLRVVSRIIQDGNTYMAHAVGAGKTSAMIGAGMEMRRLGLVRKPMYVVPNHMLGQFSKEFYEQYPTARIKVADERNFHTDRRKQFIADVAAEDLDAVIITHSSFGKVPVSAEFQDRILQDEIDAYRDSLHDLGDKADDDDAGRLTRKKLEAHIEKMEQRLIGRSGSAKDQVFTFEEMGVDFLFVDEAHMFRKLDFATKMSNVKGVSADGSMASWDLFVKSRYLETKTPGRNLVLASGTPVTNTMAELFTLSRYLQSQELQGRRLSHFDAWAGAFGDTVTNLEQDPSGGYKSVTRFAKFVNVPELSNMVRQVMDVVTSKQLEQYVTRPSLKGGQRTMNLAEKSPELENFQKDLASRMQAIAARTGPPKPGDDIILSVINDGRHAAIDMRLAGGSKSNQPSKLDLMVNNVFDIWQRTKRQPFHQPGPTGYSEKPVDAGPAAQMIFANLGLNAKMRGFAVPDYIRSELVRQGVPRGQIAYIADYKTLVARQRLFNDVNEGKVRVLIGSTAKMGTGVNAQKRLIAIHNLDPLWYPADDEQRNGRGIRQGNMNPEIEIHDYSTKGTYDSTMWGLMETKARFIQGFFEGDPNLRDMDDLGEASQYEQAKAMSTNDPRLIQLTGLRQDYERAMRRKQAFERELYLTRVKVNQAKADVEFYTKLADDYEASIPMRVDTQGEAFAGVVEGKNYTNRVEFGDTLMGALEAMALMKQRRTDVPMGRIAGFDLSADVYKALDGKYKIELALELANGREGSIAVNRISMSAQGLVQSIENYARSLEARTEKARGQAAEAARIVEQFTPQLNATFERDAEIADLRNQIDDLEYELEEESAAQEPVAEEIEEIEEDEASYSFAPGAARVTDTPAFRPEQIKSGTEGESFTHAGTTYTWSPEMLAQSSDLIRFLERRMRLMNPRATALVIDTVTQARTGRSALGVAPGNIPGVGRAVVVAMRYVDANGDVKNNPNPGATLGHEILHDLRRQGAFRPEEERALFDDNPRTRQWREAFDIDRRYARETKETRQEEGAAHAFEAWLSGDLKVTGTVQRVFQKLSTFFRSLANWLAGKGFTATNKPFLDRPAADVFDRVASGEVGRRMVDDGGTAEAAYSLPPDARDDAENAAITEPNADQRRQSMMMKVLGAQPLDAALRIPFQVFGGLDERGRWNPGLWLSEKHKGALLGATFGGWVGGGVAGPIGIAPGAAVGAFVGRKAMSGFKTEGRMAWINPYLETARAGLIDRYGLDPEYVEREAGRALDERRIQAQVPELMKTLKSGGVGAAEAKVLQAVLTGEAVPDEDMKRLAAPIRNAIDQMGQEAVELGLLSAEAFERNRGAYLRRVYEKHENDQGGLSRWISRKARSRRLKIIGDQFKGRGIFIEVPPSLLAAGARPETDTGPSALSLTNKPKKGDSFRVLDRVDNQGQESMPDPVGSQRRRRVVDRVYIPADMPVPTQYQSYEDQGTWEVRGTKQGKAVLWRDFTKAERESMGEIVDARYTIAKTYMSMSHDLATGRFFKDIAQNEEWSRQDEPRDGTWKNAEEYTRFWADPSVDWVRVPETKIANSNTHRYGQLAGRYVRAEIWRDLDELDRMRRPNWWDTITTQWKLNKTARSPVVHMNNVMSNALLMDMADVRVVDLARAVRSMFRKDADYEAAQQGGAFGSDMMSVEVRDNVLKPLLLEIQKELQGGQDTMEAKIGLIGKVFDRVYRGLSTADQAMIDAYRMEDNLFRMATYLRRIDQGYGQVEAAREARDQFLNYDIRAPWVNFARRTFLPFISYTYRAVPVISKSIAHRPWKLAKYVLVANAINALGYAVAPGDEEEERRSMREKEQGSTWVGVPRMMRMPMYDEYGNPVFLDVRRWIPAGDVFDTNQGSPALPIPSWFQFGGPLMLAAEFSLNKQGFTGRPITNEFTDDTVDKVVKTADWLWKSSMPSAAWVPGSWYWQKIGDAARGASDWQGRPYSMKQAIASSVGIKLKPQDVAAGFDRWATEFDKVEQELEFEARRVARDYERGLIDLETKESRMADVVTKLNFLGDKREATFSGE